MRSIEVSAKTIEKAIEEGLKTLDTTMENVDVEVLTEGGLFKKAKIKMTLNEPEPAKKEPKKVQKAEKNPAEEPVKPVVETEQVVEVKNRQERKEERSAEKEAEKQKAIQVAEQFLNGLIELYNVYATVNHEEKNGDIYINVDGDNLGALIGYRGATLEAFQYIMNIITSNQTGYKKKLFLNIEKYREKREETLKEMATKLANKVIASKKRCKLEPMNSYERRIIHTHLQSFRNIYTHSEGQEPNRYLIIEYKEEN